jgi:hypothetical protein
MSFSSGFSRQNIFNSFYTSRVESFFSKVFDGASLEAAGEAVGGPEPYQTYTPQWSC